MFRFSTGIFYMGVQSFATDCPNSVWCFGLTTCVLYIDSYIWSLAVRSLFIFLIISKFFTDIPFLCMTYKIASRHDLSYAFCTSRYTTYAVFPFFLIFWIASLSTYKWATVALPAVPSHWASIAHTYFLSFPLESSHILCLRCWPG